MICRCSKSRLVDSCERAFDSVMQAADVCSPHLHGDTFEPLVEAIIQARNG